MTRHEAQERSFRIWGRDVKRLTEATPRDIFETAWTIELHSDTDTHGINGAGDITCCHQRCINLANLAGPW